MALTDEESLAVALTISETPRPISETPRPLFPATRIGRGGCGGRAAEDKKHRTLDLKRRLRKSTEFKRKLLDKLSAVQGNTEAVQQELCKVKELMSSHSSDQFEDMSGMTAEQVNEFLTGLETDFGIAAGNEQPKPTITPLSGNFSAMCESTKLERSDEPLHRTAHPERPALRRPGATPNREGKRGRLSFAGDGSFVNTVTVKSYMSSAEDLWFSMPNAMVYCDQCQKPTPHSLGSMIGAWGRPRFAQGEFLCAECLVVGT